MRAPPTTRPGKIARWFLGAGALAALALLTVLTFGMHRGLVLSSDIKSRCWPWRPYLHSEALAAPALSDPVWQFVPWLRLARRELIAGEFPLWNPHQEGGVPLLGNSQSALASPLVWPALLWGVSVGWNLSLLLRVLLAAGSAFVWFRELGRSPFAASLGAIAFGLSGSFVAWLEHPHTLVAAAVPLILLFARRGARRTSASATGGLALAIFLTLGGGHPETALLAGILALAVVARERPSWRRFTVLGFGTLLGVGLAGPALFPFVEYFRLSAARLGQDRQPFTLPGRDLLRFLLPLSYVPGSNVIEAAASVSVILLLLVPVGLALRRDRETLFWGGITAAMLLIVYTNPLSQALARSTPIYWTRLLLFFPLALGAVGSAGFDALRDRIASRSSAWAATIFSLAIITASLGELVWRAQGVHAVTAAAQVAPTTPLLNFLRSDTDVFRVLPLHNFLPPNSATDYELDDIRGYDALASAGWQRERAAIGLFGPTPIQKDAIEPWDLAPEGQALDFWNVKYLLLDPRFSISAGELNARRHLDLEEVYSGPDGRVLRNRRVLPRARLDVAGSVRILYKGTDRWRIEVEAAQDGNVLIANPYFPGWSVSVDRRRVALGIKTGAPIACRVPAGRHIVDVVYRPVSWRLGLATFGTSAAALLGLGLAGARRRRLPDDGAAISTS